MKTEKQIETAIMSMIKNKFPEAWFFKPSERFCSGIPDRIGCLNGVFFGIEVKREKGKLTKIQKWTLDKIVDAGGWVCVARNVEMAYVFLIRVRDHGHETNQMRTWGDYLRWTQEMKS